MQTKKETQTLSFVVPYLEVPIPFSVYVTFEVVNGMVSYDTLKIDAPKINWYHILENPIIKNEPRQAIEDHVRELVRVEVKDYLERNYEGFYTLNLPQNQ